MEKDIIERLYDISERPDCEYSSVLYDAVNEIEGLRKALVYSDEHAAKIERLLWESLQEHIKLIEEKK